MGCGNRAAAASKHGSAERKPRQGNSNTWSAATESGRLLRGVKAKGAVRYTSGTSEGQTTEDQRHATVEVRLAVDPQSSMVGAYDDPGLRLKFAERAQRLADEMFLTRHPRARTKHTQPIG
jgi:hypothetical protein